MMVVLISSICIGIVYATDVWSIMKKEQCKERVIKVSEKVPEYKKVIKFRPKYKLVERYIKKNDSVVYEYKKSGEESYEDEVFKGMKIVEKEKRICDDSSYLELRTSKKRIVLDYLSNDFYCQTSGDLIVCDSKLDGNGDGVCDSGESCYIIEHKGCLEITQVNSHDKETSTERLMLDGVCVKIRTDASFKTKWHLIKGVSK